MIGGMDDRRRLARLALRLIEGAGKGDEYADALLAEAFDTHATAALAHAHLTGFVLELLARERLEPVEATIERVHALLSQEP